MTERPDSPLYRITPDVVLGERVRLNPFVNLYGCRIGDDVMIGTFVEIQRDADIGPRCRIQSHTFICSGVTLEPEVFVGHGVMFINDRNPRTATAGTGNWRMDRLLVKRGASIGSGAMIGAGAVVRQDVAPGATVAGVPARLVRPRA
jgi:UDP-2-acetamido-3-amino-2,3-dideoxy-glucuronate N-acetyltransferase